MRNLIGAAENDPQALDELEEFIGEENVLDLLSILDVGGAVNEMSAMGAGAVQGAAVGAKGGPWANTKEIEKDNEEEKKRSRLVTRTSGIAENNTVDEVMRLIMEKGILR